MGGHERVNRNISEDLQSDPATNITLQQKAFDEWRVEFNLEPHSAHNEQPPAAMYRASHRPYNRQEPEFDYPTHMQVRKVDQKGMLFLKNERYKFSKAFRGQRVAFEQVADWKHKVWFCEHKLGVVAIDRTLSLKKKAETYPIQHFKWVKSKKGGEDLLA